MRLVADRFVVDAHEDDDNAGCAIDLATGDTVRLVIEDAGGAADERRWLSACDDAQRERRFATPALLDSGRFGERSRFEAWSIEPPAIGAPDLDALPAIVLADRPAIAAVAELCERLDDRRPRVVSLWGPPGSGRTTAIHVIARASRTQGVVPIDTRVAGIYGSLFAQRTVLVIDRTGGRSGVDAWLRTLTRLSRPHVCLLVRDEEAPGVDGIALERLSVDALIACVRMPPGPMKLAARVQRAAEQAHGLPGRFARALWPLPLIEPVRQRVVSASRVAEQAATYGGSRIRDLAVGRSVDLLTTPQNVRPWPSAGELASLRRRADGAAALVAAGRHAPGIRTLRQVIGAFARRDAWIDACRNALALSAVLLNRGRPRDALQMLEEARDYSSKGVDPGPLVDVAVLTGEAWIDLLKLDEAERVLAGAIAAARAGGDRHRVASASVSLARCLFWRGAYAEAEQLLAGDEVQRDATLDVRRLRCLARVTVAQGDSGRAMEAIEAARTLAAGGTDRRAVADVACSAAGVKLAIGDLEGLDRDVAVCLEAARASRQPMRVLRARLLQVEADRRRGSDRTGVALAALHRLVMAAPPIVRARSDLIRALCDVPGVQTAARQAVRTGVKGLELFGGATPRSVGSDPFVDEVVAILHVCQHADDEMTVLKEVCVRIRQQLHAAAVAFACTIDRRFDQLVGDGPRMDVDVGERACQTGLVIAPHRVRERLEAAAAVQYGGRAIGALCARWTIGTSYDLSRAGAVLAMAATGAAPLLAAVRARREQPPPPAMRDLLGATPAVAELRDAVERAASAPFPVLIEGESGSGKELVARAIHRCGPRRDRAFCTLNCAALPDDLVEAELFGHTRGSFTGAIADRPGVFEEAHGGTLFLDEVGELSARAQAKLLRVLQEGEIRRVGENISRRVDARVVCATNRDLRKEAEAGRFRRDLLYRLDVIRIVVPPLRERREDVPVLVDYFWADATKRLASRATLSAATRAALAGYDWPGNVRELQNVLAALAVRSPKRGVVPPSALPAHLAASERPDVWNLDAARRSFEEGFVRAALVRSGGQRGRAAAELGVTRQGLTKLMTRLGIT